MKNLNFPINFSFKISTISNDFIATDADGKMFAYARQKMFKLKENIEIFNNDNKEKLIFNIKADKWLDFSTAYSFINSDNDVIGKIARKGWRSIWKVKYEVIDKNDNLLYNLNEENGWVKVMDSLLGEIPVLSLFSGYFFNPTYILTDINGKLIARLSKKPSLFGRHFILDKLSEIENDNEVNVVLGYMMMILLERRRG